MHASAASTVAATVSSAVAAATSTAVSATTAAADASTTTAAAAAAADDAAAATLNDDTFFFDIDVTLLCIAGLFILLALPRAVTRFIRFSEWFAGCFFRSVKVLDPVRFTRPLPISTDLARSNSDGSTYSTKEPDTSINFSSENVPTYMPAWSALFPVINNVLTMKTRPGYNVGKVLIIVGYLAAMMYAALLEVDLFTSPARLGYLATSQLPVIYIMATKNNVFGALTGQGYEKLNYLHRAAGRIAVFAVNAHALLYFAKWSQEGTIAENIEPNIVFGLIALGGMDVLFLFSLSAVRQTCYQLFFVTHCIGAIVVLAALCYHQPFAIPYVIIAAVLYGFDRFVRIIQTRIVTAHLRPIPELGMTRIEVPSINAGWRAGQHVRIRVLSTGMGILGWMESHPFTIASVSKSGDGEGLVLMCKKAGDWTNRLFDLAQRAEYSEAGVGGAGRGCKVMVNGPYGGPGHAMVTSYSGALIIVGGSGVTYALSTVQELLKKAAEGSSRVRVLDLVWSVTDPSSLFPLLPLFNRLISEANSSGVMLRISVHYTRAPLSDDVFKPFERLPVGLSLAPGRPRIAKMLEGVVDRTASMRGGDGGRTGVMVGVCGPTALGEEANRAMRMLDSGKRSSVGGVELHEEIFGW